MGMCPAGLVEEEEAFPDPAAACGHVYLILGFGISQPAWQTGLESGLQPDC